MNTQKKHIEIAYYYAHLLLLAVLLAYLLFSTDAFHRQHIYGSAVDFSEGWHVAESGEAVDLDDLTVGKNFGGSVMLEKRLPDEIAYESDLCFSTNNANVEVWIDGEAVYSFTARENLTGRGYGTMYHTVSLSPEDAGRTIRVFLSTVLPNQAGGHMWSTYLCPTSNYLRLIILDRSFSGTASLIILFLGFLMIVIFICLPKKSALPYDPLSLGIALLLLGLWSLVDTSVLQLLTGNIYVFRVLDYLLPHLAVYPLVCFVNSVTEVKRPIYPRLAFWVSAVTIAMLLVLRYARGMDMHQLVALSYADYVALFALLVAVLVDNHRYCAKQQRETGLRIFSVGTGILVACVLADIVLYLFGLRMFEMHGSFMRIGLCVFACEMLIQFMRWWSGERTSIAHDRFINHVMQYSVSKNDPESSIMAVLEYMGRELGADRVYIVEDMNTGAFDNTYEWCREGVPSAIGARKGVPFDGMLDTWYLEFGRTQRVLIPNLEAYRSVSEPIYHLLKPQGVKRLVAGPLKLDGMYTGYFGMDNPPAAIMEDIAELIHLLSYFLSQLVQQREEQKRLFRYSFYDSLTEVKNRRALDDFEESKLDTDKPYGYLMCDINGLKSVNDTKGHESGDAMILEVASCLIQVFGADNVYRTGGDEFAIYAFPESAEALNADVARVKELLAQRGHSASIGAVFCEGGSRTLSQVHAEADALMYAEKDRHYQGRNDRRRH